MKELTEMNDDELLKSLKEDVVAWYDYWEDNMKIFHKSKNFIYYSNLSKQEKNALNDLQRPPLESNVLEAYISRLVGEFSKQEPNFKVHEAPDADNFDPNTANIVEGHLEAIAQESKKEGTLTKIYTDMIGGGYSAAEVFYEYSSPISFNQDIKIRKLKDPVMCGWDPLSQDLHKGDGRFYFRIFPMTEREFRIAYPSVDTSALSFYSKSISKFSFSYQAKNEKIIALCVYYGKIKNRKKIVYLANNTCMSMSNYNKMLKEWDKMGFIEQPPKILKSRLADFTEIYRYDFIENQIVGKTSTLYDTLPGIFFDGNSAEVRFDEGRDNLTQTIRPYWKNAEGAQRVKNLALQALANDIESLVMHKFKAPKEGIPVGYEQYYINNQKAGVLIYNAFMPDGITPIPPPQEIIRQPIPPEVLGTFSSADQTIQQCLGSYDASLGINDNQLSGVAIVEAATQSNSAAMPYVVNFMIAFSQVARCIMGLMPKVLKNPRKLPIINKERKKEYVQINMGNNSASMQFDSNTMNIVVEPSVNFEVQKNKALQMAGVLAQSFPSFAQLINTKGLPIIIDNMDFRGSDQLKVMAEQQMQEIAQQKAAQANQPPPPNPLELKAQELQIKREQLQQNAQQEGQRLQNQKVEMALKAHMQGRQDAIDVAKMKTEEMVNREKNATDAHVSHTKIAADHIKNTFDAINKMTQQAGAPQEKEETPSSEGLPENPNHQ